jgi:hypothetical protein
MILVKLCYLTKSDCFNKNDFYVIDFFKSGLSIDKYYLSIDRFMFDDNILDLIVYYLVFNDIVFFVPQTISDRLFDVLPVQKSFNCKKEEPYPSRDYNFLIYGTLNGYYKVIYNTCAE